MKREMDHKARLTGVYPPVMTPFEGQKVRYDALAYNIEKMNETSLRGYMPLGSNGEFRSLTDEESIEVLRTIKKAAAPDKTIMAGVARESAYATVEFAKRCVQEGIDYASVLTPHYFASKMNDDALVAYYTYIADRCPVPILIYNAPKFAANVLISPNAVSVLAEHPNIVGMKDTSKEDIGIYTKAVPEGAEFYVLAGTINKFLKGLKLGAYGGVLSIANYMPEPCCVLMKAFMDGKMEEAERLSEELLSINAQVSAKGGVAAVKAIMDLLGYKGLEPRLPLFPLPQKEVDDMRAMLVDKGLI